MASKGKLRPIFITYFLAVTLSGCFSSYSAPQKVVEEPKQQGVTASTESEWKESSFRGGWFQVQSKLLNPISLENKEHQISAYRIQESEPIAEGSSYRTYQLLGDSVNNSVIIPKILVQSEVFGGRLKVDIHSDGNTSFTFPIALVDGSKNTLNTGYSSIPIPSEFGVQRSPSGQSGTECPEIELSQEGETLPLFFSQTEGGCPRNQFIPVTALGPTEQVRAWLEDRIPLGNVVIRTVFKPKASIVDEVINIQMNESLLFERLYAQFIEASAKDLTPNMGGQFWGVNEIHNQLKAFFLQNWKVSGFEGLKDSEITLVLDSLIERYFERSNPQCEKTPNHCFRLKNKTSLQSPALEFTFNRNKIVSITGQPIEVTSPIHDLSQDVQLFKIESEKTNDLYPVVEGRSGGTLRQLAPGDLVELEINKIDGHHRAYSQAMYKEEKSQLDNLVCVNYGEVPTVEVDDFTNCQEYNTECRRWNDCNSWGDPCIEWESSCTVCHSHGDFDGCSRTVQTTRNQGVYPSGYHCSGEKCRATEHRCLAPAHDCVEWANVSCKRFAKKRIPNGKAPCLELQNQWMKHLDLADPLPMHHNKENLSIIDSHELVNGLKLDFSYFLLNPAGETRIVKTSCSLSSFYPNVRQVGDKLLIRFRVENHPESNCSPFNESNTLDGYEPEVSLVNHISIPEKIPCGFREDYWDGKIVYTCPELNQNSDRIIYRTYYPRMDLSGKMRLPGVRFVSK